MLLVAAASPCLSAVQEPVILAGGQDRYPLGRFLSYLEDPAGVLTIDEVSSQAYANRFVPSRTVVPNFGYTKSVYWARVELRNQIARITQWMLALEVPTLQRIDCYRRSPVDAGFDVIRTGAHYPFATRDIPHHHFVFTLELPPEAEQTVYLRVQTETSMTLPLTLWSREAFWRHSQHVLYISGLFYGALGLLIAYNAFFWLALRDRVYGWFVGFLLNVLLAQAAYEGLAGQYLWPDAPYLTGGAKLFFLSALGIFGLMFLREFLDTRVRAPLGHRLISVLLVTWALGIVLIPWANYRVLVHAMSWLRIANTLFSVSMYLVVWQRGYRPARYCFFGWMVSGIFMVLFFLARLGAAPSFLFAEHGYQFGVVLMGLFFSFALTDRIQALRQEKDQAETADRAKSGFLSMMSHELRTPLTAILGYTQLLKPETDPGSAALTGIETIERSGRHLLDLVDDLSDLARIETRKIELTCSTFSLPACLGALANMVRLRAVQKGLTFIYDPRPGLPQTVWGDEKHLSQVLLNLIGNAVKFTEKGHVTLKVVPAQEDGPGEGANPSDPAGTGRRIRFAIEDTGPGIAPDRIAHIFTPFVQFPDQGRANDGIGLGLSISRYLVRLMGDDIQVSSTVGAGSVFAFTLVLPEVTAGRAASRQAAPETAMAPDNPPMIRPPEEEREQLRHLAKLRSFTELAEALERLGRNDPQYGPFAAHLLCLLNRFQFDAILQHLDAS